MQSPCSIELFSDAQIFYLGYFCSCISVVQFIHSLWLPFTCQYLISAQLWWYLSSSSSFSCQLPEFWAICKSHPVTVLPLSGKSLNLRNTEITVKFFSTLLIFRLVKTRHLFFFCHFLCVVWGFLGCLLVFVCGFVFFSPEGLW